MLLFPINVERSEIPSISKPLLVELIRIAMNHLWPTFVQRRLTKRIELIILLDTPSPSCISRCIRNTRLSPHRSRGPSIPIFSTNRGEAGDDGRRNLVIASRCPASWCNLLFPRGCYQTFHILADVYDDPSSRSILETWTETKREMAIQGGRLNIISPIHQFYKFPSSPYKFVHNIFDYKSTINYSRRRKQ